MCYCQIRKKLMEISKITVDLYLHITKKHRIHLFYIKNKTHTTLGFSSLDAKQKINFMWLKGNKSFVPFPESSIRASLFSMELTVIQNL